MMQAMMGGMNQMNYLKKMMPNGNPPTSMADMQAMLTK
jgi:hypothetical protein